MLFSGWNESFLDELFVDLCGVKSRKGLLESEDLFDREVCQSPRGSFVRSGSRHECIDTTALINGDPLFEGFVIDHLLRPIGEREGILRYPFVVGGS